MESQDPARVLVADDDPALRRQLRKRLLDARIVCDRVENTVGALRKLREQSYAMVVLDVSLPHLGAERILELIRSIRADERPVVVVLAASNMTGSLDVDLVQIILRKPCDVVQLADLVQSCVRESAEPGAAPAAGPRAATAPV